MQLIETPFPNLFTPFNLLGVSIPNRIVMPPMSTGLAGKRGEVSPEQVAFYKARVDGGVGMIIVEFTVVHRATGISEHRQLSLETEENLDGHVRLVQMIKEGGAVACLQLQHGGPFARRELIEGGVAWGPVDIPSRRNPSGLGVKAMTEAEIELIIECFGRTAELAVQAGYDAIELHGAHGYLLTSFISPYTNKRNDRWGATEEDRLRLPLRVISRVKSAIGARPLIYRLSADEFVSGGLDISDMERITPKLVAGGLDALHVSTGIGNGSFDKVLDPMSAPEGWRLPYSRRLREAVDVPVITVGQIRWPEMAEKAVRDGDADLIALGRPLLADPAWVNKARAGTVKDIRPCTSCNFCVAMGDAGLGVGCAENPHAGHELDPPISTKDRDGRKAIVIGAGPGGIVAAMMLDEAGFQTRLIEQREYTGGGLIASAAPPFKDKLDWYLDYLNDHIAHSGVDVVLGRKVDLAKIIDENPAVLIIAAGARPAPPEIPGADQDFVFDAYEVLMGELNWETGGINGPVMVYGGGETGCETAEYMAERGHKVILVTRSDRKQLARSAERVYRSVLIKRLLQNTNIEIIDHCAIKSIEPTGVTLSRADDLPRLVCASRVFVAQGRKPVLPDAEVLRRSGMEVFSIGDSRKCGRIGDAVRDAYRAVRIIAGDAAPQDLDMN